MSVSAVLLDIEGTITSASYVATVLWRHSREHLRGFVAARQADPEVRRILAETRALAGEDADPVETLEHWIDIDSKAPPLKELQGLIWSDGFASGAFRGHIYPDALAALRAWREKNIPVWLFSSGSVRTQREFFAHCPEGDLTDLFRGHFDTAIGAKVEADSYRRIAAAIGAAPEDIWFFSDNPRELEAASEAGLGATQVVREDAPPDPRFERIAGFDHLALR